MIRHRRCREVAAASFPRSGARVEATGAVAVLGLVAAVVLALAASEPAFGASEPPNAPVGTDAAMTEQSAGGPSTGTVLVTLPWGDGAGQVGLVKSKEGLTRGPEALAVSPDGRIAVLDSVNRRLVLLDGNGSVSGKIGLRLAQPRFLALDDQRLYVLDADYDRRLATYSWSGKLLSTAPIPAVDDVVTGLFATSDGACVEIAHRTTLLLGGAAASLTTAASADSSRMPSRQLSGRPLDKEMRQVATATYKPKDGVRIHRGTSSQTESEVAGGSDLQPLLAEGRTIEHLVSLDGDGHGGILVGARLLQPEQRGSASSTLAITRLTSADIEAGSATAESTQTMGGSVLLLGESDFAYLGQPYVVAPDGRVFQPVGSDAGYAILVHSLGEVQP